MFLLRSDDSFNVVFDVLMSFNSYFFSLLFIWIFGLMSTSYIDILATTNYLSFVGFNAFESTGVHTALHATAIALALCHASTKNWLVHHTHLLRVKTL